jgi:hypothetical protein
MSIDLTLAGLFLFLNAKVDGISIRKMSSKNNKISYRIFYIDSLYISIHSSNSSHSCSTYSEIPLVDDLAACRYSSYDLIRWYLSRKKAVNLQGSHH